MKCSFSSQILVMSAASWKLVVYTDASYENLPDGVSSAGGNIIFIVGENNRCCPISWCSNKIKRVVKSTIAAEALSLISQWS